MGLLLTYSVRVHADNDCATIKDPADRLACYDRSFPPEVTDTEDPAASRTGAEPPAIPSVATTPQAPQAPQADSNPAVAEGKNSRTTNRADDPEQTDDLEQQSDSSQGWFSGLFSSKDHPVIESSIVALRRRETQNLIFLLANDEIWLQDSPRANDPFRVGDHVSITRGSIGGFFLTSEDGTSTRVRRIK
jgi:hypothetical protein